LIGRPKTAASPPEEMGGAAGSSTVALHVARLAVKEHRIEVRRDGAGDVEADQVLEAKRRGLRTPDQRTGDGVGLFDGVAVGDREVDDRGAADGGQPVSDEVR